MASAATQPNARWAFATSILLVIVGLAFGLRAGCAGAEFMYDLEQVTSALGKQSLMANAEDAPPSGAPQNRLTGSVYLVIVDGLRVDKAAQMPFLQAVAAKGAHGIAHSHYPTWSRPNYVSILTGVPPQASGVRTNFHKTPVLLDTLMDVVKRHGLRAATTAHESPLPALFLRPGGAMRELESIDIDLMMDPDEEDNLKVIEAPEFDWWSPFEDSRYVPWPGGFVDAARKQVDRNYDLVVQLISLVDSAGHAHGADSEEYDLACKVADRALSKVFAKFDYSRDTLIITADHGHTGPGGHGGLEPEVVKVPFIAAGRGIVPGVDPGPAQLIDVAPTIATLLGLPAPTDGLGHTLTQLLTMDPAAKTSRLAADGLRVEHNQGVVANARAAYARRVLEGRGIRLAIVGAALALAIALGLFLRRRGGATLSLPYLLMALPVFFIVYFLLLATMGQRMSPSFLPARSHIAWELAKYGLVATLIQVTIGWLVRRKIVDLGHRLALANGLAGVGLVLIAAGAGLLWAFFKPPFVVVPSPFWLVFIPATQVGLACYGLSIALSSLLELVVYFARALDPRVRMARLERALARAQQQLTKPPPTKNSGP